MPRVRAYTRLLARVPLVALAGVIALARSGTSVVSAQPATPTVEIQARAVQPGEVLVMRVSLPAASGNGRPEHTQTDRVNVTAFGHTSAAVRQADGTWQALVGIDLDIKPGPHPITVTIPGPAGPQTAAGELTVQPKAFPTRRLNVNPALVEPPPEALDRIKRESEKTSAIYRTPGPPMPKLGTFLRPVQEAANSRFGSRSIFNGSRSSPHTGADFLSGTGTPIKAPNEGRVRLAEDLYFSGNTVILDHGNGLYSLFAHLSEFKVREGDSVQPGDVVGLVGATGRVTGPHLHWALRVNGARVDPLSLLAVLGTSATAKEPTPLTMH